MSDFYLAGLWRNTLLYDLLWIVSRPEQNQRVISCSVPTWSWASVTGGVTYADSKLDLMRLISATRVVDVSYCVEGPHMTGNIKEAAITFEAPLLHTALVAYHASGEGLRLEAVGVDIHPTFCRILWDVQKARSKELQAGVFILLFGENSDRKFNSLLGLVLSASKEKGVYTRVGFCDLSWSYAREQRHRDTKKARGWDGRKRREDMLKFLEASPIQRVVLI
jgi:hypothetical protein